MKMPTVYTTKAVLELYSQEIAKVLGREPQDVLTISVFNLRDYELAKLLQFVYNKGINDTLDSDRTEDPERSQYD